MSILNSQVYDYADRVCCHVFSLSCACFVCKQAARKEAVMQAYTAAQKYCGTVECRRSTLLKYFGETTATENCG